MTKYKKINDLFGWITFAIAAFVYLSTIEHTASFWDCGEYIATAFKLEVGHPPGAPLFQLLGRFFTLFAFGDVTKAAMMVNIMSALCSAFTILFLFWTITAFLKKIADKQGELTDGKIYAIIGSAFVGSLAYTFTDSFWFSAVEGEVYAMSSFFTAVVFWAILKWETVADEKHSDRWIILIMYLIGLSIGVHLLNLLAIPAIVFVYYFKKYEVTRKGLILTSILSIVLLGGIQGGIIPGIASLAANFDLTFVNKFGFSFNSGTIFYFFLLILLIIVGLLYTHKPQSNLFYALVGLCIVFFILSLIGSPDGSTAAKRFVMGAVFIGLFYYMRNNYHVLNTVLLCFTVLLIGYSSFFLLVIRSQANTPLDENNPENAVNLLSYLNRTQYGDWPIFYGPYYNAPLDPEQPYKDGAPIYIPEIKKDNTLTIDKGVENVPSYKKDKKKDRYVVADDGKSSIPNYDPKFCTLFPRMWSQQDNHEAAYKMWANVKGERVNIINGRGESQTIIKPTFIENIRYFINYQVGWMYFRYFMWNFSGRQNDVQGHGNETDGNWITGITAFDNWRLGDQASAPDGMSGNKGKNEFYALPLILGLIGMYFHFKKNYSDAVVVALLFFFTGFSIVIYLNPYPYQPRERDYAYAGSCYAFAMWIGIGAWAVYDYLQKKMSEKKSALLATTICLLAVPTIMAKEGWDDHDRSKRSTARDFAINYLNSCVPNAILFTNGDNDTFPLWYVQEVEGIRTDVRVCNLSLLNTDWYIDQMKRKAYDSDAIPFSLTQDKYIQGTRDWLPFYDRKINGYINVKELIDFVASDDEDKQIEMQDGKWHNYFPTKRMRIPVDKEKVLKNGTVSKKSADTIVSSIDWEINKNVITKNELMVLDLLAHNNWERPIYFAVTTGSDSYLNLENYFQLEGLAYRLVPIKSNLEQQPQGMRVETSIMYDNIMNKFKWGGMDKPGNYFDENIQRMATNMRIQMGTLAASLIEEGKKDSAIKVLDKCIEVMPDENVPYDATLFSVAVAYYQAGAIDQPNKLSKRLFDMFEENLHFYSLAKNPNFYTREIKQAQEILQRLIYVTQNFKQDALFKEFETRYNSLQMLGKR